MKKVVLTSLAVIGLAVGAFGQGAIQIDNGLANGYLDNGNSSTHYDGPFGVEIWYKNGTAASDTAINSLNGVVGQASAAYALLTANGYTLATHINPGAPGTTAVGGIVSGVGQVNIPGINRTANNGGALLAAVFWTSGNSYGGNGGVLTFNNPTADYTAVPPPAAPGLNNWPVDLVMTPVPEPATFALAGLGAAALLIFRRRK